MQSITAALDRVIQIVLLAVHVHVHRQQVHRARRDALAAADALRVGNALILLAAEGKERIGALEDGNVERELRHAHHRAAGEQLVRRFLEAAACVDQLFDRRADARFQVLRLCDRGAGYRNDTADDRHAGRKAAVDRARGVHVEHSAARVRRQLARGDLAAGAGVNQLLLPRPAGTCT